MGRVYWRQFACYSFMLTLLGVHVLFQYAVVPNAVGLAGSDWAPAETASGPDLALACEQWIGRRSLKVPKGFVGPEVDEGEDTGGGGYAAVLERRAEEVLPASTTTTTAPASHHPWAAAAAGGAQLGEAESWHLRRPEVAATQQSSLHFPRHLTNDEAEVGGPLGDNGGPYVSQATSGATLRPPLRQQLAAATPPGGAESRDAGGGREGAANRPYLVQQRPSSVSIGERLNRKSPINNDAQGGAPLHGMTGGFNMPAPSQPSTTHPWVQRFQGNHIKAQGEGVLHRENNMDKTRKMNMNEQFIPQDVRPIRYGSLSGSQIVLQNRQSAHNDVDSELLRAQSALNGAQGAPDRTQGALHGVQSSLKQTKQNSELYKSQDSVNGAQSSLHGAQGAPQDPFQASPGAQEALPRANIPVYRVPDIPVNQNGVYHQGYDQGVLHKNQGMQPVNPKPADHGVLGDGHQVVLTSNLGSMPAGPGSPHGSQVAMDNGRVMLQGDQSAMSNSDGAQPSAQGLPGNSRLLYQALPGDKGIVPGGHHGVLPGKHGIVYDNQGLPSHHGNQKVVNGNQGDKGIVVVPSVQSVHAGYRTRDDSTNPHHQRYTFNCANIQMITIKRKLGQGVTKQVYLGVYENRKVAVKMVTRNVIDVMSCMKKLRRETADLSTLPGEKHKCYTLPNMKLMKEILLLNQLDHPNLLKLQGYCVRSEETDSTSLQEHGIVAVYEYGLRFYISNLREWPWQLRVRTATELADLLEYLQHSPLGSLRISDFKDAHFLLKDGRIKLTDLDDVTSMEPDCQPNLGPELDLKGNRTPAKVCGYNLKCVAGICPGYNAMKNLDNFNRLFFSNLLTGDTPETEEHMSRLRFRLDNLSIDASELRRILFHFMDVPFLPGYS